jgi:hypothetical protein
MNIIEAAQAMKDGKTVKRAEKKYPCSYSEVSDAIMTANGFWTPSPDSLLATDWEIVE